MKALEIVEFTDTGEERMVVGLCKVCAKGWLTTPEHYSVVSPTGVAHVGADYGMTACGKDATGEKWWWRA